VWRRAPTPPVDLAGPGAPHLAMWEGLAMKRFSLILRTALLTAVAATAADPASAPAAGAPAAATSAPPPSSAATPAPVAPFEDTLSLGRVVDRVVIGDVHYLALAGGGVAVVTVVDGRPVLSQTLLPGQAVSRLIVDGVRLHAFVVAEAVTSFDVRTPSRPLAALPILPLTALPPAPMQDPSTTPTPTPPSTTPTGQPTTGPASPGAPRTIVDGPAKKVIVGKVIEVTEGRVVIDHGTTSGFGRGVRIKVIAQRLVKKPDLQAGGVAMRPSNEVTAVVALEEAEAERAMGILGRGDVAMPGDLVEITEAPLSESLFLPRRAPFNWRLGFVARPYLGIGIGGTFPVGILADAYVAYTFDDIPLSLFVEASPVGTAILGNEAHYPGVFTLGATYVTDYVEVGLGGGALIGNKGPCAVIIEEVDTNGDGFADVFRERRDTRDCEENNGATFNQVLRLGALDGIHLKWSSSIFARSTGFVFGVGRGELAVPVSSRLGLFGGGGAGENGWGYGEIGVRSFFGGTGAPGSFMLQASLGGAAIFDGPTSELIGGPLVAVGMEWRL